MSAPYLAAVEDCDRALSDFCRILAECAVLENSLFIITGDHGGSGRSHGPRRVLNRTVPWILSGVGVRRSYRITGKVRVCDTAATVLFALGLSIPRHWAGKPVGEAFLRYP